MSDAEDNFLSASYSRRRELGHTDRPGLESERRHIECEMNKLRDRLSELDQAANRFGEEPPVGTVITFTKRFPHNPNTTMADKTYSYAALRVGPERVAGAGWFLTGRDGKQPRTWGWLCDFIGDNPFRVIAPAFESGKSKFFNVLLDDQMPSNLVLIVDESGRSTVATDSANPPTDWGAVARMGRKTGIVAPGPGEHDRTTVGANVGKAALEPFEAVEDGDVWRVYDRRDFAADRVAEPVATFATDKDGERRARQSVADRNRTARREMLKLESEPPVGARIRSKRNPRRWARREPNGWVRYNGTTIQAVNLSWDTVRGQLTQLSTWQSIEPGTPHSTDLF